MTDLRKAGPSGLDLLTASEAAERLEAGGTTSVALVEDCLARIAAHDGSLHAWTHALSQNTCGSYNTASGLNNNNTASNKVAVGTKVLIAITGSNSIACTPTAVIAAVAFGTRYPEW